MIVVPPIGPTTWSGNYSLGSKFLDQWLQKGEILHNDREQLKSHLSMPEKSWLNHQRQHQTSRGATELLDMHHNHRDSGVTDSSSQNYRFPPGIRRFRLLSRRQGLGGSQPRKPNQANKLHIPPEFYQNRRGKAAVALALIWSLTIIGHLIPWGYWLILGLTGLLVIQAIRIVFADPGGLDINPELTPEELPFVSLLVAAKNEEAVIGNLVQNLCNLNYPSHCYELWVIDDNSSDRTPIVLQELAQEYQQLHILHRDENATGGKSGALNQALPLTRGTILGVFDADAQVAPDLLQKVLPKFEAEQVGAVQLQKAIANSNFNLLTRCQSAEMALDAFFQKQRVAVGGIGELRGNGEFIRRAALESCGGWCEETITDDLDLTIRLHLDHWDIEFLDTSVVLEEGVTNWVALWHQRNRWAEGGYQRYLDYGKFIITNRMGVGKTFDLFGFLITQYILPIAAIPDLLLSFILRRPPITSPLTLLAVSLSLIGMFIGLRRTVSGGNVASHKTNSPDNLTTDGDRQYYPPLSYMTTLFQTLRGTVYMFHWFIVVASATARISVRPKRLKWVKTVHQGTPTLKNNQ
ncbi:probable glycosyl transferase [Limnospira platensis NIES-39]|jgi:1,2-diacylglycerol 3-beta-glucosyltransferase|uniref:Glycosyl transferase n=2 Tax=Sirenicapillariaceae TaxID=2934961 RepID=A0A5M3TAW0_LIMPL|nr:probable glycosyl transferase [Arthrospira platensis NIES-39]GCE95008.1 putative glycosyl transferase [Arthrospira platensis NIES-46]